MIDAHCHLSWKDFNKDREKVIVNLKKDMDAVVDSSPRVDTAQMSLDLHKKYPDFVFSTLGLHPVDSLEMNGKQIEEYIEFIKKNKNMIVGIGEVGLDYHHITDPRKHKIMKDIFVQFIDLSKELDLPIIIHSWAAEEDALKILHNHDAKSVLLHCFGGHRLTDVVKEYGYSVTIPPLIATSKNHRKIAKKLPLGSILTETDSPWFGRGQRGLPTNVRIVIEKIAKERNMPEEDVDRITTENAKRFYNI